jgi:hypothetical protein
MQDVYADVAAHFANIDGVSVNSGRGSQGIKFGKRMFVMFYKGQLLVKLPPDRVSDLIRTKVGLSFDPGTGKPMKDRVIIPESKKELWIQFSEESRQYAESG